MQDNVNETKQRSRSANFLLAPLGRLVGRGMAGLGLLVVVVTATPIVGLFSTALAGPWDDPKGEILIVLGGSVMDDGTLGDNSYLRSRYAASAYKAGGFRKIIISGGGDPPVAIAMRDILLCEGIPAASMEIETRSLDTRGNALFTKELLSNEPGTKVLLTSDYHMYRAYRAFLRAGLRVKPRPIPDVAKRNTGWRGRWPAFLDLAQEAAKISYYYVRGWI